MLSLTDLRERMRVKERGWPLGAEGGENRVVGRLGQLQRSLDGGTELGRENVRARVPARAGRGRRYRRRDRDVTRQEIQTTAATVTRMALSHENEP